MAAAPPEGDVEFTTFEGLPDADVDVIFVPGGPSKFASAFRESIAAHVGLDAATLQTGVNWFGKPERRLVVMPEIIEPEAYESELGRALLSDATGAARVYVSFGAMADLDVPMGREALLMTEVLPNVFANDMPQDARPREVIAGTPSDVIKMIRSAGLGSLPDILDGPQTKTQTAPDLDILQSSAPEAPLETTPDPDEGTRALMSRKFGGRISKQNGDMVFQFTEVLAPTDQEIALLTLASSNQDATLRNAADDQTSSRVSQYDPASGTAQLITSARMPRDQDVVDLRQLPGSDPNQHIKDYGIWLDTSATDAIPNLKAQRPIRIYVPVNRPASGGAFNDFGPLIRAVSLAEGFLSFEWETQFQFAFQHPLTDAEHTRLRQTIKKTIEDLGGTYQPPSDPQLAEVTPLNDMPDQFHSDHALTKPEQDDLGRGAIAEAIATNVQRVWKQQIKAERPFAVHLSGRWGSGKSSILTFLQDKLVNDTSFDEPTPGTTRKRDQKGWVVVHYNAWQMQDAGPAWWSLLTTVREQGYAAMGGQGHMPRAKDWIWRNTRIGWPWLGALVVIALGLLAFRAFGQNEAVGSLLDADNAWKFVAAIVTALGSLGALAKLVQGWSKSATETAEAVRALQSDPTAEVKARFKKVICNIERPVAVFIDDLDRCNAQFVVDLLQSLQTSYAKVPVLYVVASDRNWIVSAYNQVYKNFTPELSKPGAPLGYLFVKKIFQLSVPVPDLAPGDRSRLTEALLRTESAPPIPTKTRAVRAEGIQAAAKSGDLKEVTRIQSEALSEGQNLADEVMKAVSDPANQTRLGHQLLDYTELFDGNPRAIKRLINAITFRQGYILSAAEDIPFDTIARWTILSVTHPYTADILMDDASRIADVFTDPSDDDAPDFPNRADAALILDGLDKDDIEKVAAFG